MRKKTGQRILAVFLCISMIFVSYFGIVDMQEIFAFAAQDTALRKNSGSSEANEAKGDEQSVANEEIKDRLMYQILYEDWDPYSSDMSLDEFYALMELFQEGSLPIMSEDLEAESDDSFTTDTMTVGAPKMSRSVLNAPRIDTREAEEVYIPRSLFLMSGLGGYEGDDKPAKYDNDIGNGEDYPPELDNYNTGYYIPPTAWKGVKATQNNNTEAFVIVPGVNDDDRTIAGDVKQDLFPKYEGHYVRRVTAQNAEVTVLGAIKLFDDKLVYYYLTNDSQSTEVSTTMLPEGQKFIVQYNVSEHHMYYEVRMDDPISGDDVTGKYVDDVFGADRPIATTDGYYSFVATAPYGYEMQIYRLVDGKTVPEEITGNDSPTKILHNEGYPLGREPVYNQYPGSGFRLNTNPKGPSTLMMSDTFFNDSVDADRTIIAVLKEKGDPVFNAATIIEKSSGTKNRGSSAVRIVTVKNRETNKDETIPYDYEDEYLYRKGGVNGRQSKYTGYSNSNPIGNIQTGDSWEWTKPNSTQATQHTMYKNDDGTYSYLWTFQTNNSDEYLMDVLEINGVPVTLPFLPKYSERDDTLGTGKAGIKSYFTEAILPHDIHVRVEMLMTFTGGNRLQRVYRIIVTNARSNVTITGMNLMMYGGGADEISTYDLNGIYADNNDGTANTSQAAVQFYDKSPQTGWNREAVSNVHVDAIDYNGDTSKHGANIRFKLADGYDSPYYLFESSKNGIIYNKDDTPQASVFKDTEGNIDNDTQNEIKLMSELKDGELMDPQYIYKCDGDWYYIRVTTQDPHKMALLTIGAREVKYVVRYLGSYPINSEGEPDDAKTWDKIGDPEKLEPLSNGTFMGIIKAPENVPEFTHIDGRCHPSFHKETDNDIPGQHYDDKNGDYYDTVQDTFARVPLDANSTPTDPNGRYTFVDWVLVDENYNAITVNGNEFHYLGNTITISEINEFAIKNDGLGGSTVDVYVIRLMPTWRKIQNPFRYKVALNWVDAQGELHEDFFDELWNAVVTDWEINNGGLTVKVLKDSTPFMDWIAQHPTYTFWDAVNNNNALYQYANEHDGVVDDEGRAEMRKEMANAIEEYLPFLVVDGEVTNKEQYDKVLDALCRRDIAGEGAVGNSGNKKDDFWRLGKYAFQVLEDEGTIVVWMYENKGGLMFHEKVEDEAFRNDEEFYYTISNVQVGIGNNNSGSGGTPSVIDIDGEGTGTDDNDLLTGTYKAYPEQVYDENGNKIPTKDKDAWLVTFKNGEIVSIVKNDGSAPPKEDVKYFTLKDGEGIMLYVPKGKYTIVETGSKSGGSYKTEVDYNGDKDPTHEGWDLPNSTQDDLWLSGREKKYIPENDGQIPATVKFDVGENNVVSVLTFHNQTCSLAIGDEVLDSKYNGVGTFVEYSVKLNLPPSVSPLYDSEKNVYYFNCNIYDIDANGKWIPVKTDIITFSENSSTVDGQTFNWESSIKLNANQIMTLVMTVPGINESVYYYVGQTEIADDKYKLADGQKETRKNTISAGQMAQEVYIYSPNVPLWGDLTIKCDVDKAASDKVENAEDIEFTYTVTINTNVTINGEYGGMKFVNNVATFKLKAGGSITAKDLPDDVSYTVVQQPSKNHELIKIETQAKNITNDKAVTKTFTVDRTKASVSGTIGGNIEDIITFKNKLVNDPNVTLPSTGGRGTVMFCLAGGSMTLLAMSYLVFTAKKRRKQVR